MVYVIVRPACKEAPIFMNWVPLQLPILLHLVLLPLRVLSKLHRFEETPLLVTLPLLGVEMLVWRRPRAGPRLTRLGRSWGRWAVLLPPCWPPRRRPTRRLRTWAQAAGYEAPCPCSHSALAIWHR